MLLSHWSRPVTWGRVIWIFGGKLIMFDVRNALLCRGLSCWITYFGRLGQRSASIVGNTHARTKPAVVFDRNIRRWQTQTWLNYDATTLVICLSLKFRNTQENSRNCPSKFWKVSQQFAFFAVYIHLHPKQESPSSDWLAILCVDIIKADTIFHINEVVIKHCH